MFDDFDDDDIDYDEGDRFGALIDDAETMAAVTNGLKPPRQSDFLVGFETIERDLLHQIENNTLPHALIFAGQQGIGKATFAYRMIRYLFKHGVMAAGANDGGLFGGADTQPASSSREQEHGHKTMAVPSDDPVFSRVASGGHPDLMTIERAYDEKKQRFKGNVDVDSIRKIAPFMRMTASQGGWRVVVVDDADTMNRNAQNAVLKILEEPPANALIILICHRAGTMIPTIRSRARQINMFPPDKEGFTAILRKEHGNLSQESIDILYNLGGASPGQALQIYEEGGLEIIDKIMALLYTWPEWQWSQIHLLADSMSRPGQEDNLRAFEDVFIWIMNQAVRAKAKNEMPPAPLNNDAIYNIINHYTLVQLIEITGNLQEHFDKVQAASLDKRHSILGAFSIF